MELSDFRRFTHSYNIEYKLYILDSIVGPNTFGNL